MARRRTPEPTQPPLAPGDHAWMLVAGPPSGGRGKSGARRTLIGAARVEVVERTGPETYTVRVVRASSGAAHGMIRVGDRHEAARSVLYDVRSREESEAFRSEVARFWDPGVKRDPGRGRRSLAAFGRRG